MLNATGRAALAIGTVAFCMGTVVWLIAYGQPANSLHASALSWSYTVMGAVLVMLGVAAAVQGMGKNNS